MTEQGRKNQNHAAEQEIGFLLKRWKLRMQKKNVYSQLWDYSLVYKGELFKQGCHMVMMVGLGMNR
jgi:hypothetical protein